MSTEHDDPLLDACLEEILGGKSPPDLAERIMQALPARRDRKGAANGRLAVAQAIAAEAKSIDALPVDPTLFALDGEADRSAGQRSRNSLVAVLLVAASICGLSAGALFFLSRDNQVVATAELSVEPSAEALAMTDEPADSPPASDPENAPGEPPPEPASSIPAASSSAVVIGGAGASSSKSSSPGKRLPSAKRQQTQVVTRPASPEADIIAFVNTNLAEVWRQAGVKPSPPATDAQWCRRLFVCLLGRAPKVQEELNPFVADKSRDKREQLVARLLTDEAYVDEYAKYWSGVWRNLLIGRGDSVASRDGLELYLRGALSRNQPYHQIITDLVTATGASKPPAKSYKPAVNFLMDSLDKDAVVPTARVARVFLGQQLQCAQCHDHPSQTWTQDNFWALNAFFRQMKVETPKKGTTKLVNSDFTGGGKGQSGGTVFYETPAGLLKTAQPRFLDGTTIASSGELSVVNRRRELARLISQSEFAAQALVNRYWAHFFEYGFTRPVDDMGKKPATPAAATLDRLSQEFVAHNYDLKSVIRWIVLSDAFARSNKLTDVASNDMPESGDVALFSRYYARPKHNADLLNSLAQAAQSRQGGASEAEVQNARLLWLNQLGKGADGPADAAPKSSSAASQIMMKGDAARQTVSEHDAVFLKGVASSKLKFELKVSHLFLAATGREPKIREQRAAARVLASSKGSELAALHDIWWAIQNSNESILDH